jgi:hypothetical protein
MESRAGSREPESRRGLLSRPYFAERAAVALSTTCLNASGSIPVPLSLKLYPLPLDGEISRL